MQDGILSVLEELEVRKVIIGKQGEINEQYEKFSNIVKNKGINVAVVNKGDILDIEKELKIKILFPTEELINENLINNNSIVAMLEYKEVNMLFTGDIEEITEQKLLNMYLKNELKADILKIPHHRF